MLKTWFLPNHCLRIIPKDLIVEMVAAKVGIALLPKTICEKLQNDKIVSIPFKQENLFLELGLTWRKNKYLSFAVREFIDLAQAFITK